MGSVRPDMPGAQPPGPAPRIMPRRDRLIFTGILVAAVAVGVISFFWRPTMTHSTAWEGDHIDSVFGIFWGIAIAILVIVEAALIYIVLRYRRPPEDQAARPAIRGYAPLEIAWVVVPFIIVTSLSVYSYLTLRVIDSVAPDDLVVVVTGRQFSWSFFYPDSGVTSGELHVPINREVRLRMRSEDVIHALWVPDFRIKKDLMPDRLTEELLTATEVGRFPLVCSRFCGVGHGFMATSVIVEEPAQFDAWIAEQTKTPAGRVDPVALGRNLLIGFDCGSCHALTDAGTKGDMDSPSLNGIGLRAEQQAPGTPADQRIRQSITDPDAFVLPDYPAGVMPKDYAQRIPASEMDVLVQYLVGQRQP